MDILGFALFPIDLIGGFSALAVMLFGLGLRIWAAVTLGKYYTTTLMIAEDHKVISIGPYARVRHPGYLGEILMWLGLGVLSSNLIIVFFFTVMFVIVYLYRISVEERMLVKEFSDDYVRYQRRTRKLIPFIY
jgi:protein-S-isoprenylcysteine O-methyltransferase Ste14